MIYIGKEFTDDYNNDAEDTLVAIGIYHLANSYYIMKEPGYFHSIEEKKDRFPLLNKTVCKINNKVKSFGWFKYYKFLVDKSSKNDLENKNIITELKFPHMRRFIDLLKLSDEYYQIIFYIYDTMLKWEFYNKEETNYILYLKNKAINKRNRDIIKK